jgi:hypothetical protein
MLCMMEQVTDRVKVDGTSDVEGRRRIERKGGMWREEEGSKEKEVDDMQTM